MRISGDVLFNFNIRISEPVCAISFNFRDVVEKYGINSGNYKDNLHID